jgi:carbamoyl-phosphate synthase large subunit
MNILFAAAGRRVSLIRSFRKSLDELNLQGNIFAADAGRSAPASFVADEKITVPRVDSPDYISSLLDICKKNNINLLISLIDSDLTLLSLHKKDFEKEGIKVLVCDVETNKICFDKLSTFKFFRENNINTPEVLTQEDIEALSDKDFPLMVKPWNGSCSVGVNVVNTFEELNFFRKHTSNAMVQRLIKGEEYTCDAYVDFSGKVRCVVPRKRLETRAGEVSKGLTVNDQSIIDAVVDCINKLPSAIGCMTVQCFKELDGKVTFIEINPRFGGGHPLTIHAGANFPKWILQELVTGSCDASFDCWENDLAMLRFDDEIIVSGKDIR